MHNKPFRLHSSSRFRLSPRGDATEAAYRSAVGAGRPAKNRANFEEGRSMWAESHGLGVDDALYLSELASGAATLRELGEALAICGQSRESVREVMARLLERGFVIPVATRAEAGVVPTVESATAELTNANVDLATQTNLAELQSTGDRSHMGGSLHRAFFRVVAARRFLASLQPSS